MEQISSMSSNPEFEAWRQELLRRRRAERFQGWIYLLIGSVGLLVLLSTLFVGNVSTTVSLVLKQGLFFLFMYILLYVSFLSALFLGISTLRSTRKSPTHEEVERVRRVERARLFQWAQGSLPWTYRRIGIILAALLGCFLLVGSFLILYTFGLQAWDGWITGVTGLMMLWLAFYVIPRDRQRLPTQSAYTLASGLVAGEETEGAPLENDQAD